jgi:Fic family protein
VHIYFYFIQEDNSRMENLKNDYQPPFQINNDILNLAVKAAQLLGRVEMLPLPKAREIKLSKLSHVHSIHSSLAIEGNTMPLSVVSDLINGKSVLGPSREIIEIKNAIRAYDAFDSFDPFEISSLLKAHFLFEEGLVNHPGSFRLGEERVYQGDVTIHIAPPAVRVPALMEQLFTWLKETTLDPLIASSIFHFEFEFIHPFEDGNGRTGRLWQSLILSKSHPIFQYLSIEESVQGRLNEYYAAIAKSDSDGESSSFVAFMLSSLCDSLESYWEKNANGSSFSKKMEQIKSAFASELLTAAELMGKLGLHSKSSFREHYLHPALKAGLLVMSNPSNPKAKDQTYRWIGY